MKNFRLYLYLLLILNLSCNKMDIDACENKIIDKLLTHKYDFEINRGESLHYGIKTIINNGVELIHQIDIIRKTGNSSLNSSKLLKMNVLNGEILQEKYFTYSNSISNKDYLYYKQGANLISIDLQTFEEKIIYSKFNTEPENYIPTIELGFFGTDVYIVKDKPNAIGDSSHIITLNPVDLTEREIFTFKSKEEIECTYFCSARYKIELWKSRVGEELITYVTNDKTLHTFNINQNKELYKTEYNGDIIQILIDDDRIKLNINDHDKNLIIINGLNGKRIWDKYIKVENYIFAPYRFVKVKLFEEENILTLSTNLSTLVVDNVSGNEILKIEGNISNTCILDNKLFCVSDEQYENIIEVYDINSSCLIHEFHLYDKFMENELIQTSKNNLEWNSITNSLYFYTNYRLIELNINK